MDFTLERLLGYDWFKFQPLARTVDRDRISFLSQPYLNSVREL